MQFLFGVSRNSDYQERYHFIIVAKLGGILTDLPGGFDPAISRVTVVIMHFTVSETLCTWETLQPCDEREQLGPGRSLKAVLMPSAPFMAKEATQNTRVDKKLMTNTSEESKSFHVLMYSCEYWMLFKKMF